MAEAHERDKFERLCRYIARPPIAEKRLSLTANGNIRYRLKTPYTDGTTHVIFESPDFIARIAALIPKPRANLTRFHGVFAPHSKHRFEITPAKRGPGRQPADQAESGRESRTPEAKRRAMTWAQRLKRVFKIDVWSCSSCGGKAKPIACITDPVVIKKILKSIESKQGSTEKSTRPQPRAPPARQPTLFG